MFSVRDSVRHSVGAVISGTQSHSSLSWRLDTDIQKEDSASILENDNTRDMIIHWVKSQKYLECEGCVPAYRCLFLLYFRLFKRTTRTMPPRKQADDISL
jgi:hypothetical protein